MNVPSLHPYVSKRLASIFLGDPIEAQHRGTAGAFLRAARSTIAFAVNSSWHENALTTTAEETGPYVQFDCVVQIPATYPGMDIFNTILGNAVVSWEQIYPNLQDRSGLSGEEYATKIGYIAFANPLDRPPQTS